MVRRPVFPPGGRASAAQIGVSPGVVSGGHMFLTGITGAGPDGQMPTDDAVQIRAAFDKIGVVLAEEGLGYDAIVEMTSYHIGLRAHFDLFNRIRLTCVGDPFPAWTAVEVAGLRRIGAIVEIRVIAACDSPG